MTTAAATAAATTMMAATAPPMAAAGDADDAPGVAPDGLAAGVAATPLVMPRLLTVNPAVDTPVVVAMV